MRLEKSSLIHLVEMNITTYRCTKCDCHKQAAAFSPGTKSTGLASWCRDCTAERAKKTLRNNQEHWTRHDPREHTPNKVCVQCGMRKDSSMFGIRRSKTDGLNTRCAPCYQSWRKKSSQRSHRKATLKRLDLTKEDFQSSWDSQNGLCALCSCELHTNTRRGCHIDHCHETGRFRGLLCGGCNTALGKLGDTPAALQKALAYVMETSYTYVGATE